MLGIWRVALLLGATPQSLIYEPRVPRPWYGRIPDTPVEWEEFMETGPRILIGCVAKSILPTRPSLFLPSMGLFMPWAEVSEGQGEWDWFQLVYIKHFGGSAEGVEWDDVPDPPHLKNGLWQRTGEGPWQRLCDRLNLETFLFVGEFLRHERALITVAWDRGGIDKTLRSVVTECLRARRILVVPDP